jgi:hypothetical protein
MSLFDGQIPLNLNFLKNPLDGGQTAKPESEKQKAEGESLPLLPGNNAAGKKESPAKQNLHLHENRPVSVEILPQDSPFNVLGRCLLRHAVQAGLPKDEQKDFVSKQLKNFEAKLPDAGKTLREVGNFSLLLNTNFVTARVKNDKAEMKLGEEVLQNLHTRQTKLFTANQPRVNQTVLTEAHINLAASTGIETLTSQRAMIEARFELAATVSQFNGFANSAGQSLAELKAVIGRKVEEILRRLGTAGEMSGGASETISRRGAAMSVEEKELLKQLGIDPDSPEADRILGRNGNGSGSNAANAEDEALFAAALGVKDESDWQSITNNKGFTDIQTFLERNGGENNLPAELDFLKNGSQSGFSNLRDVAERELSKFALDGLTVLKSKMSAEEMNKTVVGLITLGVASHEILDRLANVAGDASSGLSDDALAALLKAHNSLRDHLTNNDLVGALRDVKNSTVSINNHTYSFLPEVSEAVNALREARSRILTETTGTSADASAVSGQQRLSFEADALFNMTRAVEKFLKFA